MSSSTEHPYLSPTSHERPDHSTISSACEVGKKWWWNCRHEFERSIKSTALAIFEVESESCCLGFLQAVPLGRMNTILLRTSNFSKHSITVFWTLLENLLLSTFWPQLATRCKAKYSSLCTGYRVRFTAVTFFSGLSKHQTHQLATHQRPHHDVSTAKKNPVPINRYGTADWPGRCSKLWAHQGHRKGVWVIPDLQTALIWFCWLSEKRGSTIVL